MRCYLLDYPGQCGCSGRSSTELGLELPPHTPDLLPTQGWFSPLGEAGHVHGEDAEGARGFGPPGQTSNMTIGFGDCWKSCERMEVI